MNRCSTSFISLMYKNSKNRDPKQGKKGNANNPLKRMG